MLGGDGGKPAGPTLPRPSFLPIRYVRLAQMYGLNNIEESLALRTRLLRRRARGVSIKAERLPLPSRFMLVPPRAFNQTRKINAGHIRHLTL